MKELYLGYKKKLKSATSKSEYNELVSKIKENDLRMDSFKKELDIAQDNIDKCLLKNFLLMKFDGIIKEEIVLDIANLFNNAASLLKVIEDNSLKTILKDVKGVGRVTSKRITNITNDLNFLVELNSIIESSFDKSVKTTKEEDIDKLMDNVLKRPVETYGLENLNVHPIKASLTDIELIQLEMLSKNTPFNISKKLLGSCNYLLIGSLDIDNGLLKSNYRKAQLLGVKIITFDELLDMCI